MKTMAITSEAKKAINKMIMERAYEIESKLSKDNFFLANMAGLKPEQLSDVALKCSIKELKEAFNSNK